MSPSFSHIGCFFASRKGLLLGSLSRRLDSRDSRPVYDAQVLCYDSRERVTASATTANGQLSIDRFEYDNADRVTSSTTQLYAADGSIKTDLASTSTFDAYGRIAKQTAFSNSAPEGITPETHTIANSYDAIGRLSAASLGSIPLGLGKVNYTYTTGGALKSVRIGGAVRPGINDTPWLKLDYSGSYAGLVTGQIWKDKSGISRTYSYDYDLAARLVRADYSESGRDLAGDYSTTYAYDSNSAPTAITRKGLSSVVTTDDKLTLSFGDVDKLTMAYDGGKLVSVADAATDPTYTGAPDFRDGADSEEELFYDSNGRLVRDLNRGVENITYNRLGLPEVIRFSDNSVIRQIYSADGRLLRRIKTRELMLKPSLRTLSFIDFPVIDVTMYKPDTTDFVGPFVYENSKLVRTLVPGGYLQDGAAYYYVADHQGNVRKVLNGRGQTLQETHYYPTVCPSEKAMPRR